MAVRVELLADRVQLDDLAALERGGQLARGQLDPFAQLGDVAGAVRQRGLQAVHHRQQVVGKVLDGELVGLGHIFL
ncbi:hypothetical protein D9M71_732320 [compost metagenome]